MSFLDRVRGLFGRPEPEPLALDDPALVVVAGTSDPAEAASTALGRATAWRPDEQAVLAYDLLVPLERRDEVAALLAQDGYDLVGRGSGPDGLAAFTARRVQVVTALECSRELSRMASLAQRVGGDAPGWHVLQPRPSETDNIAGSDLT